MKKLSLKTNVFFHYRHICIFTVQPPKKTYISYSITNNYINNQVTIKTNSSTHPKDIVLEPGKKQTIQLLSSSPVALRVVDELSRPRTINGRTVFVIFPNENKQSFTRLGVPLLMTGNSCSKYLVQENLLMCLNSFMF